MPEISSNQVVTRFMFVRADWLRTIYRVIALDHFVTHLSTCKVFHIQDFISDQLFLAI